MCPPMLLEKEWSYHCDYYALLASVCVLLFGKYAKLFRNKATDEMKLVVSWKR